MAADRVVGAWLEGQFYKQQHGDDIVTRYVLDSAREDLLIFGSSRASHHYKTRQAESDLGISVYNGGRDNMGITYTASVLPYVYQRHAPRYIIVDVLPAELCGYGRSTADQRISTVLLPYANRHQDLWPTVGLAGKLEVVKAAVSKIYPYNSLLGTIIQNTYTSFGHTTDKGYEPLTGSIDPTHYKTPAFDDYAKQKGIDTSLLGRLRQIVVLAKEHNTVPIIVISPFYFKQNVGDNESYFMLHRLSKEWGYTLYDFTFDPRFLKHPELFYDELHLNDAGATLFTQIITEALRTGGSSLSEVMPR
jgi:hypothetical protein